MYGHLCAVTAPECGQPHRSGKLTCAAHSSLEERWRYYEAQGSYRRKQRMRSNGEDYEARSATCRGSITSEPRSGSCCAYLFVDYLRLARTLSIIEPCVILVRFGIIELCVPAALVAMFVAPLLAVALGITLSTRRHHTCAPMGRSYG